MTGKDDSDYQKDYKKSKPLIGGRVDRRESLRDNSTDGPKRNDNIKRSDNTKRSDSTRRVNSSYKSNSTKEYGREYNREYKNDGNFRAEHRSDKQALERPAHNFRKNNFETNYIPQDTWARMSEKEKFNAKNAKPSRPREPKSEDNIARAPSRRTDEKIAYNKQSNRYAKTQYSDNSSKNSSGKEQYDDYVPGKYNSGSNKRYDISRNSTANNSHIGNNNRTRYIPEDEWQNMSEAERREAKNGPRNNRFFGDDHKNKRQKPTQNHRQQKFSHKNTSEYDQYNDQQNDIKSNIVERHFVEKDFSEDSLRNKSLEKYPTEQELKDKFALERSTHERSTAVSRNRNSRDSVKHGRSKYIANGDSSSKAKVSRSSSNNSENIDDRVQKDSRTSATNNKTRPNKTATKRTYKKASD